MQSFNHQEPSGERDMGDQGKSTGHDVDEQPYHNGAPQIRLDGKLTLGERPQHGRRRNRSVDLLQRNPRQSAPSIYFGAVVVAAYGTYRDRNLLNRFRK